jgi:hypothetical protein
VKKIKGISKRAEFHVPAPSGWRTLFGGETFMISVESIFAMLD